MFLWTVSKRLIFTAALVAVTLIGADLATAASLSLSWKDTSSSESGFKVERLIGTTYAQIATVSANIASYIDSGLTAGSTYCYRIRAFNSAGTSSPSNLSCATALATSSTTGIPTGSGNPVPTTQLGSKWTDYRLSLKIRSNDNDLIGVMFRYRDNDNYYRFWWSAQGKSRRLEKKVAGVVHVLAEQSGSPEIAYKAGQTYFLETVAQGSSLKVKINGVQIFAVTDTSFAEGTVALYSHYNTGSVFDDVVVEDLFTNDLLLSDNFNDGDFTGWTILDEGPLDGPSSWSAAGGALIQSSNIGSVDYSRRPGTYALYTKGSWKDYRFTLKMKSADNDLLGVMFRYQDNENYYRLSWGEQIAGRRLVKREKGLFTVIAEDAVPYSAGQTYLVEIVVQGGAIKVSVNGGLVFAVTDTTFDEGTVALYSWYNQGSSYDDVLVEDLSTGALLLWDDFNNANFAGWTIIDEGDKGGPSLWSVVSGALVQNSNIGSADAGEIGTFVLY